MEERLPVVVFHNNDMTKCAFLKIADIRSRGKLCDVTLRVDDRKFTAHRIVLAGSIPYFHAMFTHDMVESRQDEITMHGIEPNALENLVNYAYSGDVTINSCNVQSLLIASSFLQLKEVKQACSEFLNTSLHPENCLGIRSFAAQYVCPHLVDACNTYIQLHFQDIYKMEEFLALQHDDLMDIISRDELFVTNEEQVFEAVMLWIKYAEGDRMHLLPELMVKVRMPLLTPQYLSDNVATEDIIKGSLRCRDLLDEAKDFHLMPERRSLLQTFKTRPRCCSDIRGIIYAVGGLTSAGDSLSTVETFDPVDGRWRVSAPMTTMRSRVGVVVLAGNLYAIGGYDGQDRLNTVELYETASKCWRRAASMNCKRSALGAASIDGKIYICGGYDGLSSLNSVEIYDPDLDVWSPTSNMVKHRSAAGVSNLDGEVFVCGGHDGLSIFDSVECYSPESGTWRMMPSMLTKRCRLGIACLCGKMYAAGGYDGSSFLKTVECYDPDTNSWTFVTSMNTKRSRVALVISCGKLYAVGGYDGYGNLNTVEIYDRTADSWTFVAPLCAHEGGVGVGVIPLNT